MYIARKFNKELFYRTAYLGRKKTWFGDQAFLNFDH